MSKHKLITASQLASPALKGCACLLAALLFLTLPGCGRDLTDAEHVVRAREAMTQGELSTSVIELKNALKINPENAEARYLLGKTYLGLGDASSAEKELRRAQAMGAPEQGVIIPLATALLLQGKFEEVIQEFPLSDQLSPDQQAELLAIRGQCQLYLANVDEARKAFDQSLEINSKSTDAMLGHALIDQATGDTEAARTWAEKVLAIEPERAEAWGVMGNLEETSGNREKAEEAYGKAIAASVNPAKYHFQRALLRIDMKKFGPAQQDIRMLPGTSPGKFYAQGLIQLQQEDYLTAQGSFEKALTKYDEYAPAQYYLGLTHILLGNEEQAMQYLRQFLAQVPESIPAANLLAKLQIRKGDLASAAALLDPVFEKDPDQQQALDMMAGLELVQGKQELAVEKYRRLVALRPGSGAALSQLGLALMASGEFEKGTAEMERAIALAPEDEQLQLKLILGQINAGEKEAAVASAQQWTAKKPESVTALLALGWAHLGARQLVQARDTFTAVLELSPGNPSASHNLAVFALLSAHIDKAIAYYEDSQMFYQGHPRNSVALAKLYMETGQSDKAVALLETVRELHPGAVNAAILLARARLQSGDTDRALEEIGKIAKAHPDNQTALSVLGAAQAAKGKYNQAIGTFKRLNGLQPLSARNHYLLAQAYYLSGDKKGFATTLQEAYRAHPDSFEIQVAMVGLLLAQNKLDEAQAIVEKLATAHPGVVEVHLQAAKLATAQNKPEEAVEALRRARELAPGRSDLVVRYALAQYQAQPDSALQTLEDWLADKPSDEVVQYNLANLYLLAGKKPEAQAAFGKIIENNPDHVLALNNMAWLLKDQAPAQALKYAERANRLAPNTASFQDTLAMILLEQPGQEKRAIKLLKNATEKAPGRPDLHYHLAMALAQNGDDSEARRVLTRLLGDNPAFPQRQEAQALLEQLGG